MVNSTSSNHHISEIQPEDIKVTFQEPSSGFPEGYITIQLGHGLVIFPRTFKDAQLIVDQIIVKGCTALAQARAAAEAAPEKESVTCQL